MQSEFPPDLPLLQHHLATGEVLCVMFPLLTRLLFIDTRVSAAAGPLVALAPLGDSTADRLKALRRLRPGFADPADLTLLAWPKYVSTFEQAGLWDIVARRLEPGGHRLALTQGRAALDRLKRMERLQVLGAITGSGYHTLWAVAPARS